MLYPLRGPSLLYLSPSTPLGVVEEGDIVLPTAEPDQSFFERPFPAFRPGTALNNVGLPMQPGYRQGFDG